MILTRRNLFRGLGASLALVAAPSIVRAASLMPVSVRALTLTEAADLAIRASYARFAENVAANNALMDLLNRRIHLAEQTFLIEWRPKIEAMYATGTDDSPNGLAALLA